MRPASRMRCGAPSPCRAMCASSLTPLYPLWLPPPALAFSLAARWLEVERADAASSVRGASSAHSEIPQRPNTASRNQETPGWKRVGEDARRHWNSGDRRCVERRRAQTRGARGSAISARRAQLKPIAAKSMHRADLRSARPHSSSPSASRLLCAGSRSYLLPHANTSDSELFAQILAIDRGEAVPGAVEGVLPDAAAAEAAAAAAAAAEPAAAAAAKTA